MNNNEEAEELEPSSDEANAVQVPKAKKRSILVKDKVLAIDYAKLHGNHAAERDLGYKRSAIQQWRSKSPQLRRQLEETHLSHGRVRLRGAGRKVTSKELDDELAVAVRNMRKKQVRVTSGMVVNEAKKLAEVRILLDEEEINLKFSRNWLTKFLRRHNFSLRKPTSVSRRPADVSWNRPFKQKIADLYNEWALRGEHELTKGGNPKPPPMAVYLDWVLKAWNSISTETIVKSFKVCGITTAVDGSEDDQIACFGPNGEVREGLEMLTQQRFINVIDDLHLGADEIDFEQDEINGFMDENEEILNEPEAGPSTAGQ